MVCAKRASNSLDAKTGVWQTEPLSHSTPGEKKEKRESALRTFPFYLEREKSLELSTYTLARYRSTN